MRHKHAAAFAQYEAHLQPDVGWWVTRVDYDAEGVEITRGLTSDEPATSLSAIRAEVGLAANLVVVERR